MRTLINLCVTIFLFVSLAYADTVIVIGQPAGEDCPTGTYAYYWNGDYPSDTDKICVDSGGSQADGVNTGSGSFSESYGESGYGWRYTTDDDRVNWSATGITAMGTIWIRFRTADATPAGEHSLFEVYYDASNGAHIDIKADGRVLGTWRGAGTYDYVTTSGTLSDSTWTTIGYSWKEVEAGNDHAITIGNTWAAGTTEDDDDLTDMGNDIDNIYMGNRHQYGYTINVDYDQIVIIASYKAACPW